jgi:hypothetical protein
MAVRIAYTHYHQKTTPEITA